MDTESTELCTGKFFSPKGWEFVAQRNALSYEQNGASVGRRVVPRALPWAENSQPFGLKNVDSFPYARCG